MYQAIQSSSEASRNDEKRLTPCKILFTLCVLIGFITSMIFAFGTHPSNNYCFVVNRVYEGPYYTYTVLNAGTTAIVTFDYVCSKTACVDDSLPNPFVCGLENSLPTKPTRYLSKTTEYALAVTTSFVFGITVWEWIDMFR